MKTDFNFADGEYKTSSRLTVRRSACKVDGSNEGTSMTKSADDRIEVSIAGVVGGAIWVSGADGQKVFDAIVVPLRGGRSVSVSFAGCEHVITAFLNVALGQLYSGALDSADLDGRLSFTDIGDGEREKIDMVVSNARRYFEQRRGSRHPTFP
jgi:hypothetical protein